MILENFQRFGSVVLAYGDGKIKNGDIDDPAFCICKHLGNIFILLNAITIT